MGTTSSTMSETPFGFSVEVAPAKGDSTAVRRQLKHKDKLLETAWEGVYTLYQGWQRGLSVSRDRNCMGTRPVVSTEVKDGKEVATVGDFAWFTWAEAQARVDAIGSGLVHLGLVKPNDTGHKLIGLYSKNRWEWVIAEQACNAYSWANVPLYDTLGSDSVSYIAAQTQMAVCFAARPEAAKLVAFKKEFATEMTKLEAVVQFEDVSDAERAAAAAVGIALRSFGELAEIGRAHPAPHVPPSPSDLAFICYTSGTTGAPKGAMITHANLVADSSAAVFAELGISQADVYLSYLPLAHVMERLITSALWTFGACVGFFQGDTLKLMEDIKALRPTLFASVPRLYNRIFDKVTSGAAEAGGVKAYLFATALESKKYWLKNGGHVSHSVWDKLVFSKIRARIGLDRCRLMVSGSAPLAPHVMEFLRCAFATPVVEGYGQTECCAAATASSPHEQASLGHVGSPLSCNEIKLVSVPEMGYLANDTVHGLETGPGGAVTNPGVPCQGRGEICYRGINVFSGYYKDPEKTAEVLEADGWLHSGDIGLWDAHGNLRVVDRKKNIFKLAQGEYVAAEKVENVYLRSPLVAQVYVHGDSLHSVLLAVVVPSEEGARAWAKANGKPSGALVDLCKDDAFSKAVLDDITRVGRESKLQGFEIVKAVHLEDTPFTPENVLTPSFKLKRVDAKKKYLAKFDAMYAKVDAVAGKANVRQDAAHHS